MKTNKAPIGTLRGDGFKVSQGGVSDLRAVKITQMGQPNGVGTLSSAGKVLAANLDPSLFVYRATLQGPVSIIDGVEAVWRITNFSFQVDYSPSSAHGVIRLEGDLLYFTATQHGEVSFTLAGQTYSISSLRKYVAAPVWVALEDPHKSPNLPLRTTGFVVHNTTDTHVQTEWQFSTDQTFSIVTETLITDSNNMLEWNQSGLEHNKTYYARVRYTGTDLGASDWSEVLVVHTSPVISIKPPSITYPIANGSNIALRPSVQASPFQVNDWEDIHKATDWQIASDAQFQNIIQNVQADEVNKTTWTPSRLAVNSIFYIRARYRGTTISEGGWSTGVPFRTINLVVNAPQFVSPSANSTNQPYTLRLTLSPFSVIGALTHRGTSWQLSKNADFSNPVQNIVNDIGNKQELTLSNLEPSTTYYVRAKMHANEEELESVWGAPLVFSTEALRVTTPTISVPAQNAELDHATLPAFTTSLFETNGAVTHASSDWELSANITFTALVASSYNSLDHLTQWQPSAITHSTTYYLRVRHRASTGLTSAWSETRTFKTKAITINKPSITSPANNTVLTSATVNFTSSAFSTQDGLTHLNTDWEISRSSSFATLDKTLYNSTANKVAWSVNDLTAATTYYVRVRHRSDGNIVSEWSEMVKFTTISQIVNKPTVTFPSAFSEVTNTNPTFTSSAFSSTGGLTHKASDWQVSRFPTFRDFLATTANDTVNRTSWRLPTPLTTSGTNWYVQVRHISNEGPVSDWSDSIMFTFKEEVAREPWWITAPSYNGPVFGAGGYPTTNISSWPLSIPLTSWRSGGYDEGNNMASLGTTPYPSTMEWQIATNQSFTSIHQTGSASIAGSSTNIRLSLPGNNLSPGVTYYLRVRYKAYSGKTSDWSHTIPISKAASNTISIMSSGMRRQADGGINITLSVKLNGPWAFGQEISVSWMIYDLQNNLITQYHVNHPASWNEGVNGYRSCNYVMYLNLPAGTYNMRVGVRNDVNKPIEQASAWDVVDPHYVTLN